MKKLLAILILSSCFIMNSQDDLEIKGTIVNSHNIPVKYATISFPSAFLRTVTNQEGKFNLSLVNMNYETSDVIEISSEDSNETIKLTIEDYLKLDSKIFVMSAGNVEVAKIKKTIATNKKESNKYTESKKTSLIFDNVKQGNKISIKNKRGKTFFKELVAIPNLKKKEFDLNYLRDGTYFFEIEKETSINMIPFTVDSEKGITYLNDKKSTYFKPHIRVRNELVLFTQISLKGEPVTIDIYDTNHELLYNNTTKNEQDIQRVFKLGKGSFKFVITSNNNEYETSINTYD